MNSYPQPRRSAVDKALVVRSGEGTTFEMPGERFTGKLAGVHTDDRFALGEGVMSPRHGTSLHRHMKSGEMFYVISGSILLEIEDDEYELHAGDIAYAPPGAAHRMTNVSDEPARVMALFSPAGPEKGLRAMGELMARTAGRPSPEELATAREMGDQIFVAPARMRADG